MITSLSHIRTNTHRQKPFGLSSRSFPITAILDMELELSLGSPPVRPKSLSGGGRRPNTSLKLGFFRLEKERSSQESHTEGAAEQETCSADPPVQLNLILPAHHLFSRQPENTYLEVSGRELEVNLPPSENSTAAAPERSASRASDEEENAGSRKKLRLSKEQSAFLEENFKEHSTLNPKQKSALAKQLNLRPRQVEVWFQNRRARTKLKQTEVDCDYLKRCCEALTAENRRLQKELSELRALKASHPFYAQLPATTLSMCAACERVSKPAASSKPRFSNHSKPSSAAS